jgi:hypothetical protein
MGAIWVVIHEFLFRAGSVSRQDEQIRKTGRSHVDIMGL